MEFSLALPNVSPGITMTNERERKILGPQFLYSFYYSLKSFFRYFVYTIKTRDKKIGQKIKEKKRKKRNP